MAARVKKTEIPAAAPEAAEAAPVSQKKELKVRRELDPHTVVTVRNGFQGRLVYKSPRTQERFLWDAFGDEQEMELQELKNARNASKAFFENNWFLIDDPEVIDCLGVSRYYAHALNFDTFDQLFEKSPEEIERTLADVPEGQKKSVAYRARQMIEEGRIDSLKVIDGLEKCLHTELVEK